MAIRLLLLAAAAAGLPPAAAQNTPLNVTPPAAAKLVADKQAILIDIRTPEEWREAGVAEGAHRLDMTDPMFGAKLSRIVDGDRTRTIALICRTASRTRTVQAALMQHGYKTVINVEGGMIGNQADKGWIAHGLPVKRENEAMKSRLWGIAVLAALASIPPAQAQSLSGPWRVVSMSDAASIPAQVEAIIEFSNKLISGRAFCNRFNASLEREGPEIRLGPIATTKMACEPPLMALELKFHEILAMANSATVDAAGRLTIRTPDGRSITARRT